MVKKYPSQIRYEERNPAITFRMKKEEKERIVQMATKSGKSVSELVRIALLGLEKDFNGSLKDEFYKGYNVGKKTYDEVGYQRGKNDWAIWVYCDKCHKAIIIERDSEEHKRVIDRMRGEIRHTECTE
jgi:hypothetical protein